MWVFKGKFTAEQGALIAKALEGAMDELFEEQRNEPFRGNADSIRIDNHNNGMDITPETLPPLWTGEVMDQDLALLGMQSLE